jgi:hypothetical protein
MALANIGRTATWTMRARFVPNLLDSEHICRLRAVDRDVP